MEAVNEQDRTEMLAAKIVGDMLRDARLRRFALSVAENLIDTWARGGRVKQQIARPLRWMLTRGISPDGKKDSPAISSDLGRLLTAWSAGVNEDHRTDPSRHIAKRGRAIGAFIDGTDFGEVCEMIESSEECVVRTVDEFNRHLWKYPAKVGSILAALLAAMNTSIRALRELMRPVEKNVGPDLLADRSSRSSRGSTQEMREILQTPSSSFCAGSIPAASCWADPEGLCYRFISRTF